MMTIPVVQRPAEGLNVIGEASRSTEPEIVETTFDVHSAGPSAAQALRDNAMKVMHLGQALMGLGIPQNEIQTGAAAVYPLYQPGFPLLAQAPGFPQLAASGVSAYAPATQQAGPPELQQVVGYHVVNNLKISLRDMTRLGDLVDVATRAGATLSGGFLYRLRDEPALKKSLLEAAGRDARSKAEVLASALGKQLGDPAAVVEDFSAWYLGGADGGWHPQQPPWLAARPPVSPGNLTFHARVNVTYRLQ